MPSRLCLLLSLAAPMAAGDPGTVDPGGGIGSYAAWAEGVRHAPLPKTDAMAFMAAGTGPVLAEWDPAIEHAGARRHALDMYPARYWVTEFPDADSLKALGGVSLGKSRSPSTP
jgi:hypothetical protein